MGIGVETVRVASFRWREAAIYHVLRLPVAPVSVAATLDESLDDRAAFTYVPSASAGVPRVRQALPAILT